MQHQLLNMEGGGLRGEVGLGERSPGFCRATSDLCSGNGGCTQLGHRESSGELTVWMYPSKGSHCEVTRLRLGMQGIKENDNIDSFST